MKYQLENIVNIQFGPHYKGEEKGEVKYLLSSHFDSNNIPSKFEKSFTHEDERTLKYFLKEGDVLLTGKGKRLFAWAYNDDMGKCIASSLFYVLRLKTSNILPKYLAYYLNSDRLQFLLSQIGAGVTILSIPKKELAKISINIPSLEEQQKMVNILEKMEEDIELTTQLLEKKQRLKRGLINHIIKAKD
ncbi:MAG: restriction endonuclease subunit S [Cytophagales bacterium]|nr:restriction endonuclease subunit S [Cytophagales bacterium]